MTQSVAKDFLAISDGNAMVSAEGLQRLYERACDAVLRNDGTIVEIGAYRGASTAVLAMAVRDMGRGHVYSIDPHQPKIGLLGGRFSSEDHAKFVTTIEKHGLTPFVTHLCTDSVSAAAKWERKTDLLWIDGDHSYEGVTADIQNWLPTVQTDGVLILDDFARGGQVEAAARDHLPYARYKPIERLGNTLTLQHVPDGRRMYLCGGMQSSGSTLVSWCFLQRSDMDGVYDMDNALIQQEFSRVQTDSLWVKATIGAFRLKELVDLYSSQGWHVSPLLITRDVNDVLCSLKRKEYGIDGATGDDPPLSIRVSRYQDDLACAHQASWPILDYSRLLTAPEDSLKGACAELGLPWQPAMVQWDKSPSAIAYMSPGNATFDRSRQRFTNLVEATTGYQEHSTHMSSPDKAREAGSASITIFKGTRRQRSEERISRLNSDRQHLARHSIFGPVLRFWRKYINRNFPDFGNNS